MTYWLIVICILLVVAVVAFRGAPYVPTHRQTIRRALKLLDLGPDDTVVDLGSGDGVVLRAVAKAGAKAIGYEINPVLFVVSWLWCLPLRPRVSVRLRDFWLADFPKQASVVFIFLAGPFMRRFSHKLEVQMSLRTRPLTVVSYGFAIPGFLPYTIKHGLYVYRLKPGAKAHMALQTRR